MNPRNTDSPLEMDRLLRPGGGGSKWLSYMKIAPHSKLLDTCYTPLQIEKCIPLSPPPPPPSPIPGSPLFVLV